MSFGLSRAKEGWEPVPHFWEDPENSAAEPEAVMRFQALWNRARTDKDLKD